MYVEGLDNNPIFPQFNPMQDWNMGEKEWSKASLRILFIFPSEMGVRSVSATHSCLYAIAKEKYGPDVFVDIWMEPVKYLRNAYEKTIPKYVVGFLSRHTWDDFDIIGFSLAITMSEFIEVPVVMRKMGLPALSAERMADDRLPLVVLGGIATDNSVVLNKYIDLYMLGLGERNIPLMLEMAFQIQAKYGSVSKGKRNLVDILRHHTGFYDPSIYHYTHNVVNGHWESTYDKCDVEGLEYVKPDVSLPSEVIKVADWQRKLSVPGGHHKVSLQSSFGCHGARGTCFFCHEGELYGAWRERSEEDYRKGIYTAKKSSMGEGFSWFSFNGNFLNNYVQSLQDAAGYFNKIGSINIRIDSLAGSIKANGDNNYIRLLKELGTTSIACPLEGISQRMRNFLNKNLTEDDILTVDKEVFKRRLIRLKHGIIWTAYETKEDYEEHEEIYRKIIELRDMQGANTQLQANCTWLVANYGTPMYYLPRKTTAMAWKQFFSKVDGKDFYFYPWMYLSDLGVKLKESSQPKDTLIQQSLQDCPGEFLDEIWVQPILRGEFDNMSTDQVLALRKGFEKYGIKPSSQFLEYDAAKNPRQHLKVGFMDKVYKHDADGDPIKFLELSKASDFQSHGCCLKTPATVVKHNEGGCVACGSCQDIDKERQNMGLPKEEKGHINWMHNRPLNTNYNLMDVKTALMVNSPSFYYQAIFKIGEKNRYIAKEALIRKWLSRATDFDESLVKNFRSIAYAFHKALDYEGLLSTYTGYELCKFGFKDSLDLEKFKKVIEQTNEITAPDGVELLKFTSAQESGGNNYKILMSVDIKDTVENVTKFVSHFEEEHRLYEGSTSMPETFAMDFDYKIINGKGSYKFLFLMPPRWCITWSEGLKKWTANKVLDRVTNEKVMAIFNQTPDGRLINVMDGKVFETSGFIHVTQSGNTLLDKSDEGIECDGA